MFSAAFVWMENLRAQWQMMAHAQRQLMERAQRQIMARAQWQMIARAHHRGLKLDISEFLSFWLGGVGHKPRWRLLANAADTGRRGRRKRGYYYSAAVLGSLNLSFRWPIAQSYGSLTSAAHWDFRGSLGRRWIGHVTSVHGRGWQP